MSHVSAPLLPLSGTRLYSVLGCWMAAVRCVVVAACSVWSVVRGYIHFLVTGRVQASGDLLGLQYISRQVPV